MELQDYSGVISKMSEVIVELEKELTSKCYIAEAVFDHLTWKLNESSKTFRIHCGDKPLIECKVPIRMGHIKNLDGLKQACDLAMKRMIGADQ